MKIEILNWKKHALCQLIMQAQEEKGYGYKIHNLIDNQLADRGGFAVNTDN